MSIYLGKTGVEHYIYCPDKESSDDCIKAHVWDYGAGVCQKFEIDRGFHSKYTGTYLVSINFIFFKICKKLF